jgi:hypothetical protein
MPQGPYNSELFFHIPLYLATLLSTNQRFEEADWWFQVIFNPGDASTDSVPARYWKYRPFHDAAITSATDELAALFQNDPTVLARLRGEVKEWRDNAFQPHRVARNRVWAYPKTVVMKYLDHLISWGDRLFQSDTLENLNTATLLYVLAAEILGKRPPKVAPRVKPKPASFNDLSAKLDSSGDTFGDVFAASENLVFGLAPDDTVPTGAPPLPDTLYFGIPRNDKLLGYWDTVADRLFKIRHCMNIEGTVRQLPLFEPPIDPDLLVRAAAAGLDLSSVLADLNAPLPHYRFTVLVQKAVEFCADVRSLGGALLSAMEKRDAEALALLRSTQEVDLLGAIREVKAQQVDEAQAALDAVVKSRAVIKTRLDYYTNIAFLNPLEIASLGLNIESLISQQAHLSAEVLGAILHLLPNIKVSIDAGPTYGGENVGLAIQAFGGSMGLTTSMLGTAASLAGTMAGYTRRQDEWTLQKNLAGKELDQIEKQILGAQIRKAVAELELKNHDRQIDNATATNQFMRDKFTNRELFDWMVAQTAALYFQSYQLAYDLSRRAERAFQFERAAWNTSFVSFGYWDSLRKGLLAGERLHFDLRRMEAAFLDQNRREFELTRHVSLGECAPKALIRLRETGECFIELSESLFDRDYPGHYLRRLKSVSLTIPCVVGPHTSVNCTLTLVSSRVRTTPDTAGGYAYAGVNDSHFRHNLTAVEAIATSSAQNDSGLFELNFHDERYLPFEGAGTVSTWRIELPPETNRFALDSIADVVMSLRYTARSGGDGLRTEVSKALFGSSPAMPSAEAISAGTGLRLFIARREFAAEWYRFLQLPDDETAQVLKVDLTEDRFPFHLDGKRVSINQLVIMFKLPDGIKYDDKLDPLQATLTVAGVDGPTTSFLTNAEGMGRIIEASFDVTGSIPSLGWTLTLTTIPHVMAKSASRLNSDAFEDGFLLCTYVVK